MEKYKYHHKYTLAYYQTKIKQKVYKFQIFKG